MHRSIRDKKLIAIFLIRSQVKSDEDDLPIAGLTTEAEIPFASFCTSSSAMALVNVYVFGNLPKMLKIAVIMLI